MTAAYHASLHRFWQKVMDNIFDGISDADCQEWAEECGLLKMVAYDSNLHGDLIMDGDFEDGDTFFTAVFDGNGERKP